MTNPPGGFVWTGGERRVDGYILDVPDGATLPKHLVKVEAEKPKPKAKRKRRTKAEMEADKAENTEDGGE